VHLRNTDCTRAPKRCQTPGASNMLPSQMSLFASRARASLSSMQVACFSKYISKSRTKRLPLTTKRVGKGYNKGLGARKEGVVNSKGRCSIPPALRLIYLTSNNTTSNISGKFHRVEGMATELIVPDLKGFTLMAYIGVGAKRHVIESDVKL
jgi:hypothetical protein